MTKPEARIAVLVCLIAVLAVPAVVGAEKRPRVTISKETTHLTGPLRPDGYVDYQAALDEQLSRGVTPGNNAAVPLMQAFGPAVVREEERPQFFKRLGISPPTEKGEYFVPLADFVKQRKAQGRGSLEPNPVGDIEKALARPWSAKEYPLLWEWLERNEKPLRLVEAAAGRPRFYEPLVATMAPPLLMESFHLSDRVSSAALALAIRATRRIEQGRTAESGRDLAASHRLAAHLGQGTSFVPRVLGLSTERNVRDAALVYVEHTKLTSAEALRWIQRLRELPPRPPLATVLDRGERYYFLDCACYVARRGGEVTGLNGRRFTTLKPSDLDSIDWDEVLRMSNAWFDRVVEAARQPTFQGRKPLLDKLDNDYKAVVEEAGSWASQILFALSAEPARKAKGQAVGRAMLAMLFPPFTIFSEADARWQAARDQIALAFAVAAYRADHARYPSKLADLTPKYLKDLPDDPFTDKPFRYQRTGGGYRLWSVGPNLKDDGGRSEGDADDVILEIPKPRKP